jgi:hypothetical protein
MEPEEVGASSSAPRVLVIGGIVVAILVVGELVGWLSGKLLLPSSPPPPAQTAASSPAAPLFQQTAPQTQNGDQPLLLNPSPVQQQQQPALPDALAAQTPQNQPAPDAQGVPPVPAATPAAPALPPLNLPSIGTAATKPLPAPAPVPAPALAPPAPAPIAAAAPPAAEAAPPAAVPAEHEKQRQERRRAVRRHGEHASPMIVSGARTTGEHWAVQIGAFHSEANAEALVSDLRGHGETVKIKRQGEWYLVQTPATDSLAEAKKAARSIASKHGIETYVVPAPQN